MEESGYDDALYGDLDDKAIAADHLLLTGRITELEKMNATLTTELSEIKQQLMVLTEEKGIVENNMIVLYNTARREMSRKDKQIADLMSNTNIGASSINKTIANIHR
jgi:hypothetical protein